MKIKGLGFPYNLFYKLKLGESKVIKNENGTCSLVEEIKLKPRLITKILTWMIKDEENETK